MNMKSILTAAALSLAVMAGAAHAQDAAKLNDLEISHVAFTADLIDIRYAHLALALSKNDDVRQFANLMVSDHSDVNDQALALLSKLGAEAQDNFLSQQLNAQSDKVVADLSQLTGAEFDRAYAANELAYHKAVNNLVRNTFIPNLDNAEVKALFQNAIDVFEVHEAAAASLVESVGAK